MDDKVAFSGSKEQTVHEGQLIFCLWKLMTHNDKDTG